MKAQSKPKYDHSILSERLQKKHRGDKKALDNLVDLLQYQKALGDIVWAHDHRDDNGVPIDPGSRTFVKSDIQPPITYKHVQVRFLPPSTYWYFLQEFTVKLCGWNNDGSALENVVRYYHCPVEFIKKYANRIWKENYQGCQRTIYIFVEGARNPLMMSSNWEKIKMIEKQTIETNTEI